MIEIISTKTHWTPETSGERLLFSLLTHQTEWALLAQILNNQTIALGGRYKDLANFFIGAATFNLLQRLINAARDIRASGVDRSQQISLLKNKMLVDLNLPQVNYSSNFEEFVDEAITCAEQIKKKVNSSTAKRVNSLLPHCYSCGHVFSLKSQSADPNGLHPTADHLWPRALGGDSNFENLLPACRACNKKKAHIASWQMAWIQPIAYTAGSINGIKSIPVEIKIALHLRAAMEYAKMNQSSLQTAFIAIGPRESISIIDTSECRDFFNMRVHDEKRTGVKWLAQ